MIPESLARAAAQHALRYPYKRWGFGEDIALRALLELGTVAGDELPAGFVHGMVRDWCRSRQPLAAADHVAPGIVLLELHDRHDDAPYLETALELAHLLTTFPVVDGVAVHRRDLPDWRETIWVDCMALDGPFLARLALVTGDSAWALAAVDAALGYARALQDAPTGLFFHGFDTGTRRTNAVRWARGNGWALHGLVDVLEALPPTHEGVAEARARLGRLVAALIPLQHDSGLWHTVLDDQQSPLEGSTAALFASGVLKARRLGLLDDDAGLDGMAERAAAALHAHAGGDGALQVSRATPVGDRPTYLRQALGVYPWGQGPLILTFVEGRRAAVGRRAA